MHICDFTNMYLEKRLFIKGYPGTGKSSMMKKLANEALKRGYDVQLVWCGLDANSIDMVILPELSFCIFDSTEPHDEKEIVTTAEELQAFYIVKSILGDDIDLNRITYKDTASYFGILIDGKVTRWICRVYFKDNIKYLIIPDENEQKKYTIEKLTDIYSLSKYLKARATTIM